MNISKPIGSRTTYRRIVPAIYLSVALVCAAAGYFAYVAIDDDTEHVARERGQVLLRLIELTRDWSARHGGVYVPVTEQTVPNEYLQDAKRDISDQFGRRLTLVNPAYMTRQIAEIAAAEDGIKFHLTSLTPVRPANQADAWENETLLLFEKGSISERLDYFPDGAGILPGAMHRYMAPLLVRPACMKCHEAQGYKVGDIRGGLSISMPADKLIAIRDQRRQAVLGLYALVAALLAGLAHLVARLTHVHVRTITEANAVLENKVAERTGEINVLYNRERYLRALLTTVSEVNESLLRASSMGWIIESSVEKLQHNPNYRLLVFSHFDGQTCHIRHTTGDCYHLITESAYSPAELEKLPCLSATARAIASRRRELGPGFSIAAASPQQRAEDYTIAATLAIPLIEEPQSAAFDVLTFCTDRREGFDAEEIRILEAVGADLTMALSAYKQRQLSECLHRESIQNYEETILAFVDMIEHRDAYTAGHTLRVAKYSRLIAEAMALPEEAIRRLEKAAILHDIGKIATPDTILLKPGRLTPLEYSLIQMHVLAGYRMLSKVKMYVDLAEIMVFHHERHDGKGYPKGVGGDRIPREAQIMIVADAFDAMTTNRIYKGRRSVPQAIDELRRHSGTQFNPEVVEQAVVALAGVTVDDTTQLPDSELEKQRFSYFFSDTLTGLHNTAYLQLLMYRDNRYYCAHLIELKRFTEFNKLFGWKKGSALLQAVGGQLQKAFPDAKGFRYQGDDFLLLSDREFDLDPAAIDLSALDPQRLVVVQATRLDLRRPAEREQLIDLLELGETP